MEPSLSVLLYFLVSLRARCWVHSFFLSMSMILHPCPFHADRSQLVLYADDLLLFRPISHPSDYCHLRDDIAARTWNNSLRFNTSKCKYMTISRKRSPVTPTSLLLLNGTPIEKVETFKYLGLLISSDLSWTSHI